MKTRIIGLLLLLVLSSGVQAVGFGGISVNSFLNEPLDARIELVSIDPIEAPALQVSLANPDAFQKAGLIRPSHLSRLEFKTLVAEDQQVFIHVTTRDGVREPFLNFLIEVASGDNLLLREYTILLDPPSSEVTNARMTPVARAEAQAPKGSIEPQTPRREPGSTSQYGPVKRTETLWVIAAREKPDSTVTVEQMMMALLEANPEAFQHGNINFLKQGAVLDVPDYETITQLKPSDARRAFLQQTSDWKALKRGSSSTAREQTTSRVVPAEESAATPQADQGFTEDAASGDSVKLQVVETGKEGTDTLEAEDNPVREEVLVAGEGRLSEEVADSRRDLEAVRAINRDLKELKDALELKIETLRTSLEERNRIIDRLEQRLNVVRSESKRSALGERGADSIVGEQRKVAGGVDSDIEMGRRQAEKKPPAKPAVPTSEPEDLLEMAQKYWLQLFVAVLLLLVLLLLILLVRRRRNERILPDPEAFGSYIDVDGQNATEERVLLPQEAARQGKESETRQFEGDFSPGARADVASALTEADIYLAYRRYGPAEELIKQAIDSNPENMILKAKLLEIYAYRKDKNKFVAVMEQVCQSMIARSPEIWAKVVEMGKEIAPDHELIAGAALSDEEADAMLNNLSFDLDDMNRSGKGEYNDPKAEKDRS